MNKVFVVDDDQDLVALLENNLKSTGFTTGHCYQGRGALSAARDFIPDLIILDVMLGDDLGFHVARDIRRDKILYKVPILFQSSADEIGDIQHALNQGGDEYLIKPYKSDQLVEKLRKMKRVWDSINAVCPTTGFLSLAALHKHLDHLIFRDEEFALIHVHILGLQKLRVQRATEKIMAATKITAQQLTKTIRFDGFFEVTAFHLGGGYFGVLLADPTEADRFVNCLRARFAYEGAEALRGASISETAADRSKDAKRGEKSSLEVGSVRRKKGSTKPAQEIIDRLRRIDTVHDKREERVRSKNSGHEHWAG